MTPTERVKRALTGHWKESNIVDADLARQLAVELEEMTTKRDGLEVIARMNSDYARTLEKRVKELESWPHCQECNFPLQDQGTPNGLVCLLCNSKERLKELEQELDNIKTHLEVYENKTHRELHMDVLHVCSDYADAKLELAAMTRERDKLKQTFNEVSEIKPHQMYWVHRAKAAEKQVRELEEDSTKALADKATLAEALKQIRDSKTLVHATTCYNISKQALQKVGVEQG